MSILGKIFTPGAPKSPSAPGKPGKVSARIKQVAKLLDQDKLPEAQGLLDQLWAERTADAGLEGLEELRALRLRLFKAELAKGNGSLAGALDLAEKIAADDSHAVPDLATELAGKQVIDPAALRLIRLAVEQNAQHKKLLLSQAKYLMAQRGDQISDEEAEFLRIAAENFPLWKEGQSILADRYLRDNRRDTDALTVYRNAYPNRKADRRLREVLLESLILDSAQDEFAASVYKDAVETSDNPEALRLLAEYYIGQGDLTAASAPYIARAMEQAKLPPAALEKLSALVLNADKGLEPVALASAIYKQGFSDRNLLAFLSDKLAEAGKFDELAIEIMTKAFEQRMVTKRAILILTENCLANDREDDFAVKVYETYLGTWPDRPQRRIYSLLAHHYAHLTRVDDQAQKIYEEALVDNPTDSIVVQILARAYHAADRRDDHAELLYRQAFPQSDAETKKQLSQILAEMRIDAGDFSEETLHYLTTMGRPSSGSLAARYDEALTNCFLAAGRRGEQAQEAYFALFERTEGGADINPRLVTLLAEIIKESGKVPQRGSVQIRVYRKHFDLEKFSTDPEIAYVLLEDALLSGDKGSYIIQLAVLVFEADSERFVELIKRAKRDDLLQTLGDFYIERHHFELASKAFVIQAGFVDQPSDEVNYRLVKVHLLEGQPDAALERVGMLRDASYARKRPYWQAAAYQQKHEAKRAAELLKQASGADDIPPFLIHLRAAINLELEGQLDDALAQYRSLSSDPLYPRFARWLGIETGIVLLKLGRVDESQAHLEEVYRQNASGRAEQMFLSLALFFQAHQTLKGEKLAAALPLFTRAVEVNRNHRALRQVIVDILSHHGETAFFRGDLQRAAEILEVAHRILPKRSETKRYLAYTYHRLKDYPKAIIYYRDINWADEEPQVERSQAYAYMENGQPDKAWRVFFDLTKRGALLPENFSRLVSTFLADPEARGNRVWEKIGFEGIPDSIAKAALLLHDGDYDRAAILLTDLAALDQSNPQIYWYLGRAYSQLGKRDLAVHNWKRLLELCAQGASDGPLKLRQLTEVGLAFLEAGYAQEAMQTWHVLRQLDEKNADLPLLYASTLDLNAYQMARKDQHKLAQDEWKKAIAFDPNNPALQQNYAIVCMLRDEFDEASEEFRKVGRLWQAMIDQNPRKYGQLARLLGHLDRLLSTVKLTKDRPDFDLTKIRAEDYIEYYQKANQFYWILSLAKGSTAPQIEHEYFRLIKIFNPERHADDFMLVEEAYINLYKQPERREMLDLMVFNPVDIRALRGRLAKLPADSPVSFERLDLPASIPPPDFSQLTLRKVDGEELSKPLEELLAISFKIPDWTVI